MHALLEGIHASYCYHCWLSSTSSHMASSARDTGRFIVSESVLENTVAYWRSATQPNSFDQYPAPSLAASADEKTINLPLWCCDGLRTSTADVITLCMARPLDGLFADNFGPAIRAMPGIGVTKLPLPGTIGAVVGIAFSPWDYCASWLATAEI